MKRILDSEVPPARPSPPREVGMSINGDRDKMLVGWRKEVDSFYQELQGFDTLDPTDIFRRLSAMTARMNYIRSQIVRLENRQWGNFRTKEIEPFIAECDRQFKFWSRCFAAHTLDWEMSKGF